MHISRKTSYAISVIIVLSFLGMGTLFLGFQEKESSREASSLIPTPTTTPMPPAQSLPSQSPPSQSPPSQSPPSQSPPVQSPQAETPQEETPGEGFALKDFHRSESRNGKLLWEIVGTNARYFPEDKRVDIEKCIFSMMDKKGEQIILHAGTAKLHLDGPELRSADFSRDVILDYGREMKILTPQANYKHKEGIVTTSAHVKVIGSWYLIEGDGLKAFLNKKHYEILHNVSSVIEPKKRQQNKRLESVKTS